MNRRKKIKKMNAWELDDYFRWELEKRDYFAKCGMDYDKIVAKVDSLVDELEEADFTVAEAKSFLKSLENIINFHFDYYMGKMKVSEMEIGGEENSK